DVFTGGGVTCDDDVFTGGGVTCAGACVTRGDGGTVSDVSAGVVVLTPTFILKLLLPRYTTLSFSPPGTGSATTTSCLSSFSGFCSEASAYDTRGRHVKAVYRLRDFSMK